ncbi:serine hydrolase [Niabella drilacis]|uniref:CubicO group peptidase, beta-lactamase class C family n=1 Tax=Niabella drilacis (strain DSM 25811 / CCM 8410 / CCUG 62505 / LMG 26954 / E90) TaxID=1285928 RepID=A0A1G6JNU7_NIADE|nr:serine hydrolase [Niabella drilacis]SDC20348.1 CubicO group peptidase, beta-lactamase class C family [Niabella drilacis]
MKSILLFAFFTCSACVLSAQTPSFIGDSLDNYIKRGMQEWQIPGLAIAIVKDGQVLLQKGYGVRDINQPGQVDENTLFMIASNSKLFTGTAIAKLEHEKKLSFNDPITRYLPWFRMWDSTTTRLISIRDVLCHRLGTKTFQGDFTFWDSSLPKDSILWKLRYLKPSGTFRQDYGYCNAGFLAAGQVLQQVTGQTWEHYVQENILTPLGMERTFMSTADMQQRANAASPHSNMFSPLTVLPFDRIDNLGPAASMVSNVRDLTRWLRLQLDSGRFESRQFLPWEVLQKTRDANITVNSRRNSNYPIHFVTYGLGLYSADYNGRQIYWHTGGAFGFVSSLCFVPEEKLGIVILTNNDNQSFFEALRYQILDAYLGVPYKDRSRFLQGYAAKTRKETATELTRMQQRVDARNSTPVPLDAYTGDYYNTVYGRIRISRKGTRQLSCSFQHHPDLTATLEYMDNNTFRLTYSNIGFGVFPAVFTLKDGKPETVQIKATDFIEYDAYLFARDPQGLMVK